PRDAKDVPVTSGTPTSTTLHPVARTESTRESYCATKRSGGVISAGLPGLAKSTSALRTSLEPAHTVTKVGCSSIINSTSVLPPSLMVLSRSNELGGQL